MILKQKWSNEYYDIVMSVLAYVASSDKYADENGLIRSRDAARALGNIDNYAYVRKYDLESKDFDEKKFTIHVSVAVEEQSTIDTYLGYAAAGGFLPYFSISDKFIKKHSDEVLQSSRQYAANCAAEKEKLEAEILSRIKDYIDECDVNNTKPVKKHLVTEKHTYAMILKVWDKYEQGEYETKSDE